MTSLWFLARMCRIVSGQETPEWSNIPDRFPFPRGYPSREMVEQARARNTTAIQNGRVDLRRGSVISLPFDDNSFDKALAINSMQVWPAPAVGLREMRRVMKSGARVALGFTPYSGQPNKGLTEALMVAGFTNANVVEKDTWFCALGVKP